jgi:hypothetical protein
MHGTVLQWYYYMIPWRRQLAVVVIHHDAD